MDISELRQAITALKQLGRTLAQPTKYGIFLDDAVAALDGDRIFAGYSKLANTAANMLEDVTDPMLRSALSSLAFHGYQYCVANSDGRADFTPSMTRAERIASGLNGPVSCSHALGTLRDYLTPAGRAPHPTDEHGDVEVPTVNADGGASQSAETSAVEEAPRRFFKEAVSLPMPRRLSEQLFEWRSGESEDGQGKETPNFEKRLRRLLDVGEEGRRFGDFAIIDDDLAALRSELPRLEVPRRPQDIQERAKVCRNLAPVDFRSADASLYRSSRHCWLVAAFWNSALTELWPTNDEQFIYDALGYLTVIQAEHRYATHVEDVLLLLRVSHLICRIASSEELISTNFYEALPDLVWVT